jgi:hypothetical protein
MALTAASIPSQLLLTIHPDNGVVASRTIYLADAPVWEADDNGIYTPYFGTGINAQLIKQGVIQLPEGQ